MCWYLKEFVETLGGAVCTVDEAVDQNNIQFAGALQLRMGTLDVRHKVKLH